MNKTLPLALLALASTAMAQIPCLDANYGTALVMGDDTYSAALPLGFTFNYGGVAYTDCCIASNGYVTLGSTNPGFSDYTPSVNELLTAGEPRIAGLWHDLEPNAGGTIYYNNVAATPTTPAYFTATYDQVLFWGTTNPATFQIVIIDGDGVQIHFESDCAAAGGTWLVGASPGTAGVANPISFNALPIVTAGNPTLHEDGIGSFPLADQTHSWNPDGTGGWIVTAASQCANKSNYGQGCVQEYASFYEAHSTFDLSNTSLLLTNTGVGYLGIAGTTAVVPSTSTPVVMGDDVVLPFALGWTLPYPGGTTTDVWVSSNGFLNLTANTLSGCCAFNLNQFLTNGPVFAAKWRDLNPSAGGSVYFDTDTVAGTATVTFDMVPDYNSTNQNTFQYYFDANGTVELRFGTVAATAGGTGWSPGLGNVDPGSIDLSATPVILTGANDIIPLALNADASPVINTTINLVTSNIPTTAAFGGVLYGLTKINPGINLASFGMPDCFQYNDQLAVVLFFPNGATSASVPFTVPNFVGVPLQAQAAVFDPVSLPTPLGGLSSNGVELILGN